MVDMTANDHTINMDPRRQNRPRRSGGGSSSNNNKDHNGEDPALSFPLKLHAMLEDAESKGFANIVSWQAGNKSFKVHDINSFGGDIMPMYFNQTKFKSFQRQ